MDNGEISYFSKEGETVPKGKIPLYAILEVSLPAFRDKKNCAFSISTSGRTFMIEALTPEDATTWYNAVRGAVTPTQALKVASFVFQEASVRSSFFRTFFQVL